MPKVLIADKLSPAADDILKSRGMEVDRKVGLSKDELIAVIGDYDGLAVRSACKPDADVINAAERLRVIGRAGIGVDNIDVKAATARGVVVMNTPFGNSITTAEHAIALLFAAARQVAAADASTQAGKWEKSRFMGLELFAKTLGIIGCGNIGGIVADRAIGLKMKVIAFDPFLTEERALEIGVEKVELDELLARADAISLHTPLTDKTRNILSEKALGQTKKGVIVVNCARGGLVDEVALRAALEDGHVAAAAFDVFTQEPAQDNPLFGAPNFVATPHLGAATAEAQENVALQVAEQIADYLATGAIANALNTPSVTAEEAPRLKPYIALAERLGLLAGQLLATSLKKVDVVFEGAPAELNTKPLMSAALAGVLRPALSDVNLVSAPSLASARGVHVSETKRDREGAFEGLIRITVETERRSRTVAGSLFAGEPRIVEIDGVSMDAAFTEHMLYVENEDKPGFIGALGGALAEAEVNIATFNLGRKTAGGEALCLVAMDEEAVDDLVDRVKALEHVRDAKALEF
ncbi:MAG: phosphoglycerate dehydrogenase [Maricaulaceae bacterium]|jgi:D-3-phosphoglycerate dehydrogenase